MDSVSLRETVIGSDIDQNAELEKEFFEKLKGAGEGLFVRHTNNSLRRQVLIEDNLN